MSSVARETVSFTLCDMVRPRTASEAASAVIAVRFTPELKEGLERLAARTRERLAEQGITASVTESDVLRGLVAKAVKELDAPAPLPVAVAPVAAVAPTPPPPPPVAARVEPPAPTAPSARKPVASKAVSKAVSTTDYTGVELPAAWVPEHREAHRKCAAFVLAHPGVTQNEIAHALGFNGDSSSNFNAFLRGKKALPQRMWPNIDSVLASLES